MSYVDSLIAQCRPLFVGLALACFASAAFAGIPAPPGTGPGSFPEARGSYTGTLSEQDVSCTAPSVDSSESVPFTVVIDTQSNNSFYGTATAADEPGNPATFLGLIDMAGAVTGSWSDANASGGFTGTLSGNTLSLNIVGTDVGYPTAPGSCLILDSATVSRSGAINPAVTAGITVTTPATTLASVRGTTTILNQRFGAIRNSDFAGLGVNPIANGFMVQTGAAAGDGFAYPFGFWGSFSRTESDNDFVSTAFDSSRYNFLVGGDFSPREGLVMGLALGYETQDVDTFFNAGKQDMDGYTVVPYVAASVGDHSSLDFAFGYSDINTKQFRVTGGTLISSSVDSERYFVNGNLTHTRAYGLWNVSGQLGALWAKDVQKAFAESNGTVNTARSFKVGQWRIGGEAAYTWGVFEPYARATFQYDFTSTKITFAPGVASPKFDQTDVLAGFGVRYFADNGISGSLEYNTVLGRENYSEDTLQFLIRAEF